MGFREVQDEPLQRCQVVLECFCHHKGYFSLSTLDIRTAEMMKSFRFFSLDRLQNSSENIFFLFYL